MVNRLIIFKISIKILGAKNNVFYEIDTTV